ALSFWALLNGCADNMHLLRVVNKPKRGIGLKGQEDIMAQLSNSGQRVSDWLNVLAKVQAVGAAKKLQPLAQLLVGLRASLETMPDRGLMALLEQTSYIDSLQSFGELEAASRLDNIKTLQAYIEVTMQEGVTPIELMDRAALLQSGEEDAQENVPKVNLMSLHRAKGLEFDTVVVAGVEEGLLPHQRALDEGEAGIAEERRLLYVGVTRAKNALLLTSARQRKVFGDMHYPLASSLIKDLPHHVLQRELLKKNSASNVVAEHDSGLGVGSHVAHPSFGEGVILSLEGSGDATRISIEFERVGLKRLMLKYAALKAIS
ncbi:MAG: 3'-5' exonuclease, partial [Mariprofundaceae bacterium]|nr:3'-5' exonuclease [Mariprofundaceae bacterium]